MNVALFIARRISLKQDNGRRQSPAVTIAVSGIALSIVIMLLTLAVVPGFKHQIRDKLMGFDAQITLSAPATMQYGMEQRPLVTLTPRLAETLERTAPGADISLTVKQPGIIKTDSTFAGVVFHGYDARHDWSFVENNLAEGVLPDYSDPEAENDIIISRITASQLGLKTGDRVNTYFFSDDNLRTRRFTVAAIYDSHFGEYDKLTAYMFLPRLQRIAGADSLGGTAIEIRGLEPGSVEAVTEAVEREAAQYYYSSPGQSDYLTVSNVYDTGLMYFNWLDLLDTNVLVIMILMGCVAGVTLISCLFIMILERINLIGILKALGADNATVRRMFIYMAERIVIRGIVIGNVIGLALVAVQRLFRVIPLDPEAYYLSYVPVEFNWTGIVAMNLGAVVLSLIIMILPTHIVANISPAKVMRYE